jgi:hypothetical protein
MPDGSCRGSADLSSILNSLKSPGVLVRPPHVRKCHQMPSKEHIQLGWVVRWVLSTPPGHGPPRGWAVLPCRASAGTQYAVPPLLLCTRPARARPSIGGLRLGVKAPLPLRASSRGVLPGARGWCSGRLAHSTFCSLAHWASSAAFSPHSRPRRFHHHQLSDEEQPRWAYFVRVLFRIAVPGGLNSRVSQIRSWQGALSQHAFMIRSR